MFISSKLILESCELYKILYLQPLTIFPELCNIEFHKTRLYTYHHYGGKAFEKKAYDT